MRAAHLSLTLILLIPQVALGSPLSNANTQDQLVGDLPSDLKKYGLTTLLDYVVKAGLAETLASVEPATIFAPTNEAFAALPKEVVDKLNKDPKLLKDTLLYHVIPNSAIRSSDLKPDQRVNTAAKAPLRVDLYPAYDSCPNCITVNGVKVTKADVAAGSGSIVHVVDKVLPTLQAGDNLAAVLKKDGRFNTLLAALSAADLAETVGTKDGLTVFAPTDDAFGKIPKAALDDLLKPENKDKLVAVLTGHVLPQPLYFAGIWYPIYPTLEAGVGVFFPFVVDPTIVMNTMRKRARLVDVDIIATNGVAHSIDTVLI